MLQLVPRPFTAHQTRLNPSRLAAEWLLDSGICRPGFGISEEFRRDRQEYAPVSKRATGYYVSSLIWLFESTGETRYIDHALTAAQFLTRSSDRNATGLRGGRMSAWGPPAEERFDQSNATIRALLRSWEISHHSEFLTKAIDCAESMEQGLGIGICPLRAARGWFELAEATGNGRWRELYDRSLAVALAGSAETISWTNSQGFDSGALLTAGCCFLEALLPAIMPPGDQSSEAVRAFRKVFFLVADNVLMRSQNEGSQNFIPTEAYARILRLRLNAASWGLAKLDVRQAELEALLIRDMQASHNDPRIHGGFYTDRHSGINEPAIGMTATATAAQALAHWQQFQDGDFRPDVRQMV